MQVSIEAPNSIQRRMTVVVPEENVEQAFIKRIQKLSKTAKVNGFRPGKVPFDVIKQHYGSTAREEALGEVIQQTLYAALHQEQLSAVSVPRVEPKNILPGQPLEYVATFEILPAIPKVNFELTALEKETAEIQEKDIDRVIENLQSQQAQWKLVNRPAQEKDRVIVDFKGTLNGVPFEGGQAHDYPIIIGSKSMVPGFEEGVLGLSAGEEKTIPITFAENYFSETVAGKQTEFTIKVHKVFEAELPVADEAFAKKLGIKSGSLEDLRNEIKNNLQRELVRTTRLKLKTKVFNHLVEKNPLELPPALVERETTRIHDQFHPHHAGAEHHHSEAEMAKFKQLAEHNVALGLLIGALAKEHHIIVEKEAVKKLVEELAAPYQDPQAVIKWYMTDSAKRQEVEMQVLEEEVLAKLLEKVTVTEKVMTYEELMNVKSH